MVTKKRTLKFTSSRARFRILCNNGVNVKAVVQAVAAPSMLYGCECVGVSDTALFYMRSSVLAAAAPSAGGKCVECAFYAIDGATGTLETAFSAKIATIKTWATAFWLHWAEPRLLQDAHERAARQEVARQESAASGRTGTVGA